LPQVAIIVDRSATLLAKCRTGRLSARCDIVNDDILLGDWVNDVSQCRSPRTIITSLTITELPIIDPFFKYCADATSAGDRLVIFTMADHLTQWLLDTGLMLLEAGASPGDDFFWAGKYPACISGSSRVYLPHFQRGAFMYRRLAAAHGFLEVSSDPYKLSDAPGLRSLFDGTLYGRELLTVPAGLLLVFERTQRRHDIR